jgi:hypothetical protein
MEIAELMAWAEFSTFIAEPDWVPDGVTLMPMSVNFDPYYVCWLFPDALIRAFKRRLK